MPFDKPRNGWVSRSNHRQMPFDKPSNRLGFAPNPPREPSRRQPGASPGTGILITPTDLMFSTGNPPAAAPAEGQPPVVRQAPQPVPVPAEGKVEDRLIPHTTMRKRIAEHIGLSKHTS